MPLLFNGRTYPVPLPPSKEQWPDKYVLVWEFLKRNTCYDYFGKQLEGPKPEGMEIIVADSTSRPLVPIAGPLYRPTKYIVKVPEPPNAQEWLSPHNDPWTIQLDMLGFTEYLTETSWPSAKPTLLPVLATASTGPPGEGVRLPHVLQASSMAKLPESSRAKAQEHSLAHMKLILDVESLQPGHKLPTELGLSLPPREGSQGQVQQYRDESQGLFHVQQRDKFLNMSLFKWGFTCTALGESWEAYEVAVFPFGSDGADAFVMPRNWLMQLVKEDAKTLLEAEKLICILDMDHTILHCVTPRDVSLKGWAELQLLANRGMAAYGFDTSEIIVPRFRLLDILRMAYGIDNSPPKARYELYFCTAAAQSRGLLYLEKLRGILKGTSGANEQWFVEDATKEGRFISTHRGGCLWKVKDIQDVVPHSLLMEEGNKMIVAVDDSREAWTQKDQGQVVKIAQQQNLTSYAPKAQQEQRAGEQLKHFLEAVHEQQVSSGYGLTVSEAMHAVNERHGYNKLSIL